MDAAHAVCRFCSKSRHVAEFVAGGPVTGYCRSCLEWSRHALDVLAGKPPRGCQECERTFSDLSASAPGADVRLYLHPKDGMWALLCKKCSDNYEAKRKDLYGRTPYGKARDL